MISQWLESFAKWPPMNQLAFSCLLVIVAFLLIAMLGYWVLRVISAFKRPEPPFHIVAASKEDKARIQSLLREARPAQGLRAVGHDWREEQRQILEERKYQAEVQAQLEAEMRQAGTGRQEIPVIPCTPEATAGHTNKEGTPARQEASPRPDSPLPPAPPRVE